MLKAYKCPKCCLIQLKGKRCVEDGTYLEECSLENEISRPKEIQLELDNNNNKTPNPSVETNEKPLDVNFMSSSEEFFDMEDERQIELRNNIRNIVEVSNLKND